MRPESYKKWIPGDYLREYYSTEKIAEDEIYIFKFILQFINFHGRFKEMLDFGSGPTIHHIIPFEPYVRKVYIADYLDSNLREVDKWVNGKEGAHDWRPYFEGSIKIEKQKLNERLITSRIKSLKKKTHLLKADIFKARPINLNKKFVLVTSFYCVECTTSSKVTWKKAIKNILNLVAPGGWILMSSLRKAKFYRSGDMIFPSANIDEKDLYRELKKCGFDRKTIDIRVHYIKQWRNEGFNSIIICKAKKPL